MNKEVLLERAEQYGTPLYLTDLDLLQADIHALQEANVDYGFTIRDAAKANHEEHVIRKINQAGLSFDAASAYEAKMLVRDGVEPSKISLSSQVLKGPLEEVLSWGVLPVATWLRHIQVMSSLGYKELGVRINPPITAGAYKHTNVGGISSPFGIWHEYIPEIHRLAEEHEVTINRLHVHIGSGIDSLIESDIWQQVIDIALEYAREFPDVTSVDVGGGFPVARMPDEKQANMDNIFKIFDMSLKEFELKTGRKLDLEIEPGGLLVANSGILLASVEELKDTGPNGYKFVILDSGMGDNPRPALYGAQHPMTNLSSDMEEEKYVVYGPECESGALQTPERGKPGVIEQRGIAKVSLGDIIAIGGVGAYCAELRSHGYCGFPPAPYRSISKNTI